MIYNTWQAQALALDAAGDSWRSIAKDLGLPKSTVSDYLRKNTLKNLKQYAPIQSPAEGLLLSSPTATATFPAVVAGRKAAHNSLSYYREMTKPVVDNSRILFISDLHFPYQHANVFEFLQGLKNKYQPTRIICLGDELDKHALSFHDSDPDLDSAGPELEKCLPLIKRLETMFPVMDLIDSNHGSMVYRKAKHHGIPRRYIKDYNEVLGVGKDWKWHMDMVLELPDGQQVYVHHGKTQDALKVSQTMGMSFVCGHFHENFGVKYWANPNGLYFAMNSGCLINDKSLAFAYNNTNLKRPIVGTSLIINGAPVLEAMPL